MMSVVFAHCYAECSYANWHYGGCHGPFMLPIVFAFVYVTHYRLRIYLRYSLTHDISPTDISSIVNETARFKMQTTTTTTIIFLVRVCMCKAVTSTTSSS